ncbi:hypothetical protein K438DRAFT_1941776 [Mycena galopus ATCC 62051]|nr:hypothetical protein K438DRAFT_1941776 [Mycena galopus ATCC 62051]
MYQDGGQSLKQLHAFIFPALAFQTKSQAQIYYSNAPSIRIGSPSLQFPTTNAMESDLEMADHGGPGGRQGEGVSVITKLSCVEEMEMEVEVEREMPLLALWLPASSGGAANAARGAYTPTRARAGTRRRRRRTERERGFPLLFATASSPVTAPAITTGRVASARPNTPPSIASTSAGIRSARPGAVSARIPATSSGVHVSTPKRTLLCRGLLTGITAGSATPTRKSPYHQYYLPSNAKRAAVTARLLDCSTLHRYGTSAGTRPTWWYALSQRSSIAAPALGATKSGTSNDVYLTVQREEAPPAYDTLLGTNTLYAQGRTEREKGRKRGVSVRRKGGWVFTTGILIFEVVESVRLGARIWIYGGGIYNGEGHHCRIPYIYKCTMIPLSRQSGSGIRIP